MRALLDTHAFVWALTEPDQLSSAAREVIEDPAVPLLVSAATAWEMSIKHRAGRWPLVAAIVRNFEPQILHLGATPLPLSIEHALAAGSLEWDHRDPFDRVLAAQAIREGVPLITKDRVFAGLPGLGTLW